MQGGDIIVQLDEQEVADRYAFADALRGFTPGDRLRITVLREGQEVTVAAVLGSRSA